MSRGLTPTPAPTETRFLEASNETPDISGGNEDTTTHYKRSTAPKGEIDRKRFKQFHDLIRRYSDHPEEMDKSEVVMFLKKEAQELREKDPLIELLILKEEEKIDESADMYVGAYKIVSPSIKELNDSYLGPNATDEFIAELNDEINSILSQSSGHKLHTNIKGGIFIMDFKKLVNGSDRPANEVLDERLEKISKKANSILLEHIKKRIDYQAKNLKKKIAATKGNSENEESEEEKNERIKTLLKNVKKVQETICRLEKLGLSIDKGKSKVKIAFGFDKLGNNLEESYTSIKNAECSANLSALSSNGHRKAPFYSDKELLIEVIQGIQELGVILDDEDKIPEEWQEFFYVDPETHDIRMQPEMIVKYRRLDNHKLSDEYLEKSEKEKEEWDQRMKFFSDYYGRINLVDVLKPFQADNIKEYLERIENIAKLIKKSNEELKKEEFDYKELRQLLSETSHELEISLRDEGAQIVKTTRALIKNLMEPENTDNSDEKILVFADNMGFGALNQSSYENSILELIRIMNISNDEWDTTYESDENLDKLIGEKLEEAKTNPEFAKTILAIGDLGTKHIRDNEKRLSIVFGGKAVIDGTRGDDTTAIFHAKDNPEKPRSKDDIEKTLLEFSKEFKMRIAALLTNFRFSRITDPAGKITVQDQQRSEILTFLNTILPWSEEAHGRIKDKNATGETTIEIKEEEFDYKTAA